MEVLVGKKRLQAVSPIQPQTSINASEGLDILQGVITREQPIWGSADDRYADAGTQTLTGADLDV